MDGSDTKRKDNGSDMAFSHEIPVRGYKEICTTLGVEEPTHSADDPHEKVKGQGQRPLSL